MPGIEKRLLDVAARLLPARTRSRGRAAWYRGSLAFFVLPDRATPSPTPISAFCVYRRRNAHIVERLVAQLPADTDVHLHALDEPAPELSSSTRAIGPGHRMPLLQSLYSAAAPPPDRALLIFDDDVLFRRGGGCRFPGVAAAAGLDIAQPAHALGSRLSLNINRARPLTVARRTGFVEIGPVVYLGPRARELVFPLPAAARMGWGVDVLWADLRKEGLRLGVVDATPVVHMGAVGIAYDDSGEQLALAEALSATGHAEISELTVNIGPAWRKWQRRPPWLR